MRDYKKYLKDKLSQSKAVTGSATLNPPAGGQLGLQSSASMAVLDLVSEGPIYGLVDGNGKKTNNMSVLESLYLNDTAVLGKSVSEAQIRNLNYSGIQSVNRLTSQNIETAFNTISGELSAHASLNLNNPSFAETKINQLKQEKEALKEFIDENPSLQRFGFAQFKLSGIFPTGDEIYSRVQGTQFEVNPEGIEDDITSFVITWSNPIGGTITTTATYAGTDTLGSKDWSVPANGVTYTLKKFSGQATNTYLWGFGDLYSFGNGVMGPEANSLDNAIPGATASSSDYPWQHDRMNSTWWQYNNGIVEPHEWNVTFTNFKRNFTDTYNATTFDLNVYNGANLSKRTIKNEENESIEIPGSFVYGYQSFNTSIYDYTTAPNALQVDQAGKVGLKYLIDGFAGGGMFFFEMGDAPSSVASRFFVDKTDTNLTGKLQSGKTYGYDVFVYDSTGISLEKASPNQSNPSAGEVNGKNIGVGYISDSDFKYNYGNIDFEFRNGHEFQSVMDGHSEGTLDFFVRKKLYGPLQYGGTAASEDGYSDPRGGGDFSDWMINPPLESDSYPYTHTIKRNEVKKCYPTIAIEALSDVISDGADAGVQRAETLSLALVYGFEGGVTGSVGELLSGGNSLQEIALGLYETTQNIQYNGIVVSNYLDTYSGIGDLPKNKILKDLKVNNTDVPGLTSSLMTQFGYNSQDYIFPGEDWKVPNRFLRVEKLSYETDSTLINRDCSLSYVTETIGDKFNYPLVALAGTIFDARNFAAQPERDYEVRGKLIAIPSNYEPLNENGSDKRFVTNSNQYGLRDVVKFGANSRASILDAISIGTDNFEISFKFKCDTLITNGYGNYIFEIGPSTSDDYLTFFQLNGQNGFSGFVLAGNSPGITNDIWIPFTYTEIGATAAKIFEVSIKCVDKKYTMDIMVNGVLKGSKSSSYNNARRSFTWDDFRICSYNTNTSVEIADFKIKKNNQLLHFFDGTIIDTTRSGPCLKDKFGGSHAKLLVYFDGTVTGDYSTVKDSTFKFGKNKTAIYNGAWDGTFKLGWSDNPAWILYDLMINPIYGVGNNLDDREDINIFNLYQIARYCDAVDDEGYFDGLPDSTKGLEPRFSCNLRIYDSKNAFEVIGNIASIFRGFTYWDGVGLNFALDRPKEVSAIFNNNNVFDGNFNYADIASSARFTKVEVMYADARDIYQTKVEYVEDEEAIRKYGIINQRLNGIGCTSKSQARRLGQYVLLSNKLETEITQFKAGGECLFLEPGDIIRIDDELKNFEINYGKVLEVGNITPNPYVLVENSINTSSIKTGQGGNIESDIYLYTNRKQNELENLYEIIKYKTTYQFGEDSDVYSGVVDSEFINEQSLSEISKINVTGAAINAQGNTTKLYLDTGDPNFEYLSGVQSGSFFNLELKSDVNEYFKIVKKTQVENNLFEIEAMEYSFDKFEKIENEDYDDEVNTHNIGILSNVINRPLEPTVVSQITLANNLSYKVSGTITAAANSNETSYRVVLYRTNLAGPYIEKEFLRESDDTTSFEINGLIDGYYTVSVAALRNPESSNNYTESFVIDALPLVYMHPLIKTIDIADSAEVNYERISGSGFGSGVSDYEDPEYRFITVDQRDVIFSLTQLDFTLDIYAEKSGEYVLVKQDHENDIFIFNDVDNASIFGSVVSNFNLKFDLKKDGTVVDSAFFETTLN